MHLSGKPLRRRRTKGGVFAMTTVTIDQDTTYVLKKADQTLTFASGTNIDVTTVKVAGVYGDAKIDWAITNLGSISGSASVVLLGDATFVNGASGKISNTTGVYTGIYIEKTGHVTNKGTITGSAGTGNGGASAIYIKGAGTISNAATGIIVGNVDINGAGTITNAGSISNSGQYFADIALNSTGSVTNSGSLETDGTHASGIYAKGKAILTNTGTITASSLNVHSSGINLHDGGKAINARSGAIAIAGEHGVGITLGTGGAAVNAGNITGSAYYMSGIESTKGGAITNSGSITLRAKAHVSGVELEDGGSVDNTGKISITVTTGHASGVEFLSGGALTNSGSIDVSAPGHANGVDLADGGTVKNLAGGSITAAYNAGIYAGGTTGVIITNAGTISGGVSILLKNAGASSIHHITNTLTLASGSELIGAADGSTGAFVTNDLIFEGSGTASNTFANFQNLTVDKGAAWTLGASAEIAETTVLGSLTISSLGSLSGAVTLKGGKAVFDVAYDGAVTFKGLGTLELSAADTGMISGLGAGDKIDLLNLIYSAGDKAQLSGDTLSIETASGSTTLETLTLGKHTFTKITAGDLADHVALSFS
jgi:hypothetical protein